MSPAGGSPSLWPKDLNLPDCAGRFERIQVLNHQGPRELASRLGVGLVRFGLTDEWNCCGSQRDRVAQPPPPSLQYPGFTLIHLLHYYKTYSPHSFCYPTCTHYPIFRRPLGHDHLIWRLRGARYPQC